MKFACMSCGAKYSVPDGRLQAAGAAGLRVRCSRCRAIMVVAESQRALQQASSADDKRLAADDEDTRKELRFQKKPAVTSSDAGLALAMSSAGSLPPHMAPGVPAELSASGVFRPMPGVNRQVTGLFFPELEELKSQGKNTSSRVWYAAIQNRPRGPFSAAEMIALAERGKVRDSTLVWRPGFSSWRKVKHGEQGTPEDLSWLRKPVLARKLKEMDAAEHQAQRMGIQPVNLTRTSSGGRKPSWSGGAGLPPPLPDDAHDEPVGPDGPLQLSFLTETHGERPRASSSADAIPFAWRADELPARPSTTTIRRRQRRVVGFLGVAAGLVGLAMIAVLAMRFDVVGQLVAILSP